MIIIKIMILILITIVPFFFERGFSMKLSPED